MDDYYYRSSPTWIREQNDRYNFQDDGIYQDDGDEFNGWYNKEEPIVEEITYLDCPYREKNIVKKLGGKWDKEKKKWYCPSYLDPIIFQQWIPNKVPLPSAKETMAANKMLKKLD